METIGLIAAMQTESAALLRCSKIWKRISVGPYRGYQSQLYDRNCVLITSGMGLKRASAATRILVDQIHPQLLISFGIAGAANRNLQIGDVVVAKSVYLLVNGLPNSVTCYSCIVRNSLGCSQSSRGTGRKTNGHRYRHHHPGSTSQHAGFSGNAPPSVGNGNCRDR